MTWPWVVIIGMGIFGVAFVALGLLGMRQMRPGLDAAEHTAVGQAHARLRVTIAEIAADCPPGPTRNRLYAALEGTSDE